MPASRRTDGRNGSHRLAYGCCLILGIAAQGVALLQPRLSGDLIAGVQKNDSIACAAAMLGVLVAAEAILTAVQQAILGRIGEGTVYRVRCRLVDGFLRMRMLDREKNPPAWYSQRISNDAALIKSIPVQLLGLVQSAILIIGSGLALVRINSAFFLVVLFPAAAAMLFVGFASKPIKKWQNNVQEATMGITSNVQEAATAMRMLTAYDALEQERKKLYDVASDAFESGKKLAYLYSSLGPAAQALLQAANILAILYGAYQVARGRMEFTSLVMFLMYFSFFSSATTSAASALSQLQQALVGKRRADELMAGAEKDETDPNGAEIDMAKAPGIAFSGVGHRYPQQKKQSLNQVTFQAPPQKITALVGESGGGKTTCLSLMERFFGPASGKVLVNGADLSRIAISSLREGTGYVEQDPCILTGTIRDNVRIGDEHATDDEILSILETVGLRMPGASGPEMLDCRVGESGLSLSGGQKQRIALARALARKPRLLLMDEPTSSLDGIAERRVVELIRSESGKATVIYSAHRLSLILGADWIVVIKDGSVLAEGTHDELMRKCGYYRRLVEAQYATPQKRPDRHDTQAI